MASLTDPFSGEESFNAPTAKVYAVITSFDAYAKAIPGLVSADKQPGEGGGSMKAVIKPGFSFASGTVKANMRFTELTPDTRAVLQIDSSGIGMTLNLEAAMNVIPDGPDKSKVQWTGRVTSYTGLVKLAPAALVRGAADKVIKDGWTELRKQIEV